MKNAGLLCNHIADEMRGRHPTVAECWIRQIRRPRHRLRHTAAVPHRRARPLERFHRQFQFFGREMLALKVDFSFRKQALDQGQAFNIPADPRLVVQVHDLELVLGPAGRHTEDQSPAGDDIKIGGLLRHMERMEQRQNQHTAGQRHAFSDRREAGQKLQRRKPGGRTV